MYNVRQEPVESPAAYFEWLQEAFRCYTPYDPEAAKTEETLIFVFVNQAACDIRNKLVKLEGLGERNIRDLMTMAERVFYKVQRRKRLKNKDDRKKASLGAGGSTGASLPGIVPDCNRQKLDCSHGIMK